MDKTNIVGFSGPVTVFHHKRLPESAMPVGYAALIHAHELAVPLPRTLFGIGTRHRIVEKDGWKILTPRHAPQLTLAGQLTFALKNEGLDLVVLKRLFKAVSASELEALIHESPTGGYVRRIWFLYEWLIGEQLDLPDAKKGGYVSVVDPKQQWAAMGQNSPRHRVKNNLPGTPNFCPLVFRTKTLEKFMALQLEQRAQKVVADVPKDVLARTAAFLLLSDSRASYAIEGERPPQNRIQRWGTAIGEAGRHHLNLAELLRLQKLVIGDDRLVQMGLRTEGGFVGQHDRETQLPLPDHISAKAQDLRGLLDGLFAFYDGPAQSLDPVVAAAVLAFGFVYIHPFEDGNGRLHRYFIHHVLATAGFNPSGVVFPVSSAILDTIDRYRDLLKSYSSRILPLIEWETTEQYNVRVTNDTADYYRFFDATPHVEFLFACVQKTIEEDLPREADFLQRYDQFRNQVSEIIDMPERTVDLLFRLLQQNEGRLAKRRLKTIFAKLTKLEVEQIEQIYQDSFGTAPLHNGTTTNS